MNVLPVQLYTDCEGIYFVQLCIHRLWESIFPVQLNTALSECTSWIAAHSPWWMYFLYSCTQTLREDTSCTAVHRLWENVIPVQLYTASERMYLLYMYLLYSCAYPLRTVLPVQLYTNSERTYFLYSLHRLWKDVLLQLYFAGTSKVMCN